MVDVVVVVVVERNLLDADDVAVDDDGEGDAAFVGYDDDDG